MTWRTRSPYAVLPDPCRAVRLNPGGFAEAHALGGFEGLVSVARDALRDHVVGRATHPAEVPLLREWLDEAAIEEAENWLGRRSRPARRDVVAEVEERVSERRVEPVTCSGCGLLFGREIGARGRPRTRCDDCRA